MPVMGHSFAEQRRQAAARRCPRHVSLGLAVDVERKDGTRSLVVPGDQATPTSSTSPTFAARYDELVAGARDNTLPPDAYQGANITLTNPGGIGTVASRAAADARPGHDRRHRRDRLPARAHRRRPGAAAELGVQKVMTMTSHLRPPRDPGRRVGRVPAPDRRAAPGRGRLLRRRVRARSASTPRAEGAHGAAPVTAAEPVPAAATPAAAPRRRRRAAPGRAGRHLARQGAPHARPPGRATSTRSAPSRSATPRSSRRPWASRPS